jgi:hypothetical protein
MPPLSGSSSTTRTLSIERDLEGGAHSTSSSVPVPASFLAEQIEVLGGAGALASGGGLALHPAGQVGGDECDDEEEDQRDHAFGIGDGRACRAAAGRRN